MGEKTLTISEHYFHLGRVPLGGHSKMDQGRNSLSCEMCSCLLFMNSHAILTTSSSLNERCVEDDEEAGAVLPAATASAAAAAIVNSFRPMDQGEGGGGGREGEF